MDVTRRWMGGRPRPVLHSYLMRRRVVGLAMFYWEVLIGLHWGRLIVLFHFDESRDDRLSLGGDGWMDGGPGCACR